VCHVTIVTWQIEGGNSEAPGWPILSVRALRTERLPARAEAAAEMLDSQGRHPERLPADAVGIRNRSPLSGRGETIDASMLHRCNALRASTEGGRLTFDPLRHHPCSTRALNIRMNSSRARVNRNRSPVVIISRSRPSNTAMQSVVSGALFSDCERA
jgi:hypothetical protein